jgi:AcrR family transcriptional regulator
MARVIDDSVRERLIAAGIKLVEQEGVSALQARRVASAVGASTMVLYTHFDGMTGLIDAIFGETLKRFVAALHSVPQSDNPVADYFAMGIGYHRFALANPQCYQLIFGPKRPEIVGGKRTDLTVTGTATDRPEWGASFEALVSVVRRMISAGHIRDGHDATIAGRIWSMIHGVVMLELAGFFGQESHGLTQILAPMSLDLIVGLGGDRDHATASMIAAATAAFTRPS